VDTPTPSMLEQNSSDELGNVTAPTGGNCGG
jgi:hypothetical protein